jgi:hypothetical protein
MPELVILVLQDMLGHVFNQCMRSCFHLEMVVATLALLMCMQDCCLRVLFSCSGMTELAVSVEQLSEQPWTSQR